MKPFVIGTQEDVAGFALAGIEGVVCATREEADQTISRADEDTLLIVSHELAVGSWRLAGDRLLVVLPSTTNRQPPTGLS